MATSRDTSELRLVHVRVARADDLVDARDRLRSVGERGDRVRAADRPHLVDAEQLRRRRDEACAAGGVTTTIRATPGDRAGTAHMTSVETRPRGT